MGGQIKRNKFEEKRRVEVRDCVVFRESFEERREEDDLLSL